MAKRNRVVEVAEPVKARERESVTVDFTPAGLEHLDRCVAILNLATPGGKVITRSSVIRSAVRLMLIQVLARHLADAGLDGLPADLIGRAAMSMSRYLNGEACWDVDEISKVFERATEGK